MPDEVGPRVEYERRLGRWQVVRDRETRRFEKIAWWRLAVAIAMALLIWLAFRKAVPLWTLAIPSLTFLALVVWHDRVARRRELAGRALRFYDWGLARIEDRWPGMGNAGERFRDSAHAYAEDLDLFGRGSLFELLCTARTLAGEETLAAWLKRAGLGGRDNCAPPVAAATARPERDIIMERQQAVEELRPRVDLRESLALLGEDVRAAVHPEVLVKWATAPAVRFPRSARPVAVTLALLALITLAAWLADSTGSAPFTAVVLGELIFAAIMRRRVDAVVQGVERPAHDLEILSLVLHRLEQESFSSAGLAALANALRAEDGQAAGQEHGTARPASSLIAELDSLVEHREWSENLMFRIPGFLLTWDERYAMRIEQWRQRYGSLVARWMDVLGEMEALSALAGYAFEHPQYGFPEMARAGDGPPRFEAEELYHPLMSPARCVPNDLYLGDGAPGLLIVSGSNMSGKSTLLRAVGLNVVLASAGAPVAARRLRLSPLALGASIRVMDSLLDNRSRFYSEITRLRQILDLTSGPCPVLFLIDEMLHGTNSHDRRIGAEAVVRGLLDRGAVGLVTTHDLALAGIADSLAAPGEPAVGGGDGDKPRPHHRAANVHFEDHLEDGQIRFDYRLRPGVVRHSNALDLMRSLGLIQ